MAKDPRRKQNEVLCYQEARIHGRNSGEISMRESVPFRDTVRDWYTGFFSNRLLENSELPDKQGINLGWISA
jgi:hypothetical protein